MDLDEIGKLDDRFRIRHCKAIMIALDFRNQHIIGNENSYYSLYGTIKTGDADRFYKAAGSPKVNPPNVQNRSVSPVLVSSFPDFGFHAF
jgi:hypothetical protein